MDLLIIVGIFMAGCVSNTLSILKTMFTSKKLVQPVYMIVFLDTIIFGLIMKSIVTSGLILTIVYALGKVSGVYVANLIEDKLALGISEIELYLNSKDKMKEVADGLRNVGYSVNSNFVWGKDGEKRYSIETTLARKEIPNYYNLLDKLGVENPTTKIINISSVNGKINVAK